jgi:beta-glucosidase
VLILFFSHGLSYTTFQLDDLQVGEISTSTDDINVAVSVSVTNSGSMHGTEVVQLYVQYPSTGLTTPKLQLKGFAKTKPLAPGERATVTIDLDKYACSFWDEEEHHWRVASGDYSIFVGTSSANLPLSGRVTVEEGFEWVGL